MTQQYTHPMLGPQTFYVRALQEEAQRQKEAGTFEAWCEWAGFAPELFEEDGE